MTAWKETALLGIYTLTPTHYGTGQNSGAVDQPIARNVITGHPILPATGIKGVLRDRVERKDKSEASRLFGPEMNRSAEDQGRSAAGRLSFTEARLLAYPVRALTHTFLHVTCPHILSTLVRDLRATGAEKQWSPGPLPSPPNEGVLVSDAAMENKPLVLESLIFRDNEVKQDPQLAGVAEEFAKLLPEKEEETRTLLERLVLIPDGMFKGLMETSIPARARVQLTSGKTTDAFNGEKGNLWYEEFLPSDCLFLAFVGACRDEVDMIAFHDQSSAFKVIQIGGNETVGHGLCFCSLISSLDDPKGQR